jgi:Domain of unknown function (DUF4340)
MRPRTLLILLALVAGLGGFVWFYERELPGSEKRAEQAKKLFGDLESDDVTAVGFEMGGKTVRLERVEEAAGKDEAGKDKAAGEGEDEDGGEDEPGADGLETSKPSSQSWRMTQPLQTRADATAVGGLLQALRDLEKTRTLEDPDPKALGLDKPQATVRLTTEDGERVLRVGAKIPTSASVVAAFEGEDEAYVVSDAVLANLQKAPGEWRDRQVVHAERDKVDRLVLRAAALGSQNPVTLTRRGDAFWVQWPGAAPDRADRELVDALLTEITGLRAQRFVEGPQTPAPAALGLTPPAAVVEVMIKGEKPLRVELGGPVSAPEPEASTEEPAPPGATALYARAGGQLIETQTALAAAATRPADEWRARGLSRLAVHQVDKARIKQAGTPGELVLTRSDADWKRGEELIPFTPVSDLLFTLTDARAERLLTPQEAATLKNGAPQLTVILEGEAGAETLTLYPETAAGVPAQTTGRPAVLLLPAATGAQIRQNLQAVRTAQPVSKEEAAEAEGEGN